MNSVRRMLGTCLAVLVMSSLLPLSQADAAVRRLHGLQFNACDQFGTTILIRIAGPSQRVSEPVPYGAVSTLGARTSSLYKRFARVRTSLFLTALDRLGTVNTRTP